MKRGSRGMIRTRLERGSKGDKEGTRLERGSKGDKEGMIRTRLERDD